MQIPLRVWLFAGLALIAIQMIVLAFFGQPVFCECGAIKLWEGNVLSNGNSQQLTDWYTFSHIIHGFLFYAALRYIFPRLSFGARLAIAFGVEIAWEIAENTPYVINYYREQALAQGYTGDSILNSVSDTIAMAIGFFGARKLPVALTIVLVILLELFVIYFIRDSLFLNVLNFIYIFPVVETWQASSGIQ